jgi:hypothetical protein
MTEYSYPPVELLALRSDPTGRPVLADWLTEHGYTSRLLRRRVATTAATATATAADAATDAATAAADDDAATATATATAAAADAAADDAATAADDAADAADDAADAATADAADDADAATDAHLKFRQGELMRDGLKILQFSGRYNYLATFVGWVRRVGPEHYELSGFRPVWLTGTWAWDGLVRLAAEGPGTRYGMRPAAPPSVVREFIEGEARNVHSCDEAAWAKECPKPEGWGK